MSLFKLDRMIIILSHHETISFQMSEVEYLMSYTDFFVAMGLVDMEYSHTESYSQLHVDLLTHLRQDQVWIQTLLGRETYVYGTLRASTLG